MSRIPGALLLALLGAASARAQTPMGTLSGMVIDGSGAALPNARVDLVNAENGQMRTTTSADTGTYSVPALPPGAYRIVAEAAGFRRLERLATVEVGSTTTVDLQLALGDVSDTVTVRADVPLLRNHPQVGGVVGREQIETLPLNGRNFLDLARLEPGVTNPTRGGFGRTFVPSLGAGLATIPRIGYTRATVDGANIITVGTVGTALQVSQEAVQEFQMSTVGFDASTSLTTSGAINIVTRSGSNEVHGSGFYFYRDHNLAAYPGLSRDARNPDPFFQRRQFGASAGGPVRRERAFVFGSYEQNDQRSIVSVQPGPHEFAWLRGLVNSPYLGHLLNARADVHVNSNHNIMGRFTYDGNRNFGGASVPSAWGRSTAHINQTLGGLTSVLTPRLVNEVRLSYFRGHTVQEPPGREDCPDCFGIRAERITVSNANLTFGSSDTSEFHLSRYQLTDTLTWQRGGHSLRFGFDWEHGRTTTVMSPVVDMTVWSPAEVRQRDPTRLLPASFQTEADFLQLPLRAFTATIGPHALPERGFHPYRILDLYRLYASDTWRVGPALTINAGLGWSLEPNALNHDLDKPALLVPLLGREGLEPPHVQYSTLSPTLGLTWTATRDGRTIVRGGAGRYFDPAGSANGFNLANERILLSPLGSARISVNGGNIIHNGSTLDFSQGPGPVTGAELLAILPQKLAEYGARFDPANRNFSVRTLDFTKSGQNLFDPAYAIPHAIHLSLGVQRQLGSGFAVGADGVWKHFVHTFINGIDYNHWNSLEGPVIRPCSPEQIGDLRAQCSTGSMFFDTTIGRARYKGLLVRVEKRSSRRYQFLASYALGSYTGTNGTGTGTSEQSGGRVFGFNTDDWFENDGPLPTDLRHVLNVSGSFQLPRRIQLAFNLSAYSRPPFSPYVANMDFNGDGSTNDLLPGTRVNQFGRSLDAAVLERLVAEYNEAVADRFFGAVPRKAPRIRLPDEYSFADSFFTQDLRVSRSFRLGSSAIRLFVYGEVFNVVNTANLTGHRADLTMTDTFGKPSARFTQIFGSGGPRAFQFAARVAF
jgi:hypothetical protein